MTDQPPNFPVGPFAAHDQYDATIRQSLIEEIGQVPGVLRAAVKGLADQQLDTRYKNWTIRQIVHHVADSHLHAYIRFKWAMCESNPTIKAYDEAKWVELDDAKLGDIAPALALIDGLHEKWAQLLATLGPEELERTFYHPQLDETVRLWTALNYYPWHSKHHAGQIRWLREFVL